MICSMEIKYMFSDKSISKLIRAVKIWPSDSIKDFIYFWISILMNSTIIFSCQIGILLFDTAKYPLLYFIFTSLFYSLDFQWKFFIRHTSVVSVGCLSRPNISLQKTWWKYTNVAMHLIRYLTFITNVVLSFDEHFMCEHSSKS